MTAASFALRRTYPTYETEGFRPLYTRPPQIYLNESLEHHIPRMATKLGLPVNNFCVGECLTSHGANSQYAVPFAAPDESGLPTERMVSARWQDLCSEHCWPELAFFLLTGAHHLSSFQDVGALERLIQTHQNEGRMPTMVFACAGTANAGHVDEIKHLRIVCDTHALWLHVAGYIRVEQPSQLTPSGLRLQARSHQHISPFSVTSQPVRASP